MSAFSPPRSLRRCAVLVLVLLVLVVLGAGQARADGSTFRVYGTDQGLTSFGGSCMVQDNAGYILVCTEHGVFAYDARRFVNLGTDQGLRQGGEVYDIALTASGRIAVRFAEELLMSDRPSDASHPPSALSFQSVQHDDAPFYDEKTHRLAPWRDGLVLLAGGSTLKVSVPETGAARTTAMGYSAREAALLQQPASVFAVQGHLWEAFDDGRLCAADPGHVTCFGAANGLQGGPWRDVVAGADGQILARSASSVGSFDPSSGRWSVVELPDQGGRYGNYEGKLGLFRTPDGGLVTQASHGLVVQGKKGWTSLNVDDGAPSGTIVGVMTDATGQFWFHVLERGLVRWVGYGHWEAIQKVDGLFDSIPWQTARLPDGTLWVSTDTGVDEVVRGGASLQVARVIAGSSYTIAAGPHGALWRSAKDGVRIVDPATGAETRIDVPLVDAIVPDLDGAVWLGTQSGLFRVEDHPGMPLAAVRQGSPGTPVLAVLADKAGGVFYLSAGRLHHRHADGRDVLVPGAWPTQEFEPGTLAMGHDGDLWIGGSGGVYRFVLSNDHVVFCEPIPTSDTRTNSIVAVMIDHRNWVWVGTSLGVSVFDRQRWVSIDADNGLISNDVDQGGIREDPDGSVWITTTQGLSHLLDPAWLFADRPLKVVVSSARLGSRPVTGLPLPYTKDALSLQFGTPNYAAEQSLIFRYNLSGVDTGNPDSNDGLVHYPSVPPGHHVLTVVGYDELTHRSSPPATLVIDIAYPWWRQWWAEAAWLLALVGSAYGLMKLRFRTMSLRQQELQRLVAQATEQLRYDSLTGLLIRSEIERRLAQRLFSGDAGTELVVALLDIDHFKHVNDTYGHLGGDDVLRAIGRLVSATVWDEGDAGRYGGEEVLLVLDDADGCGAERILNLLQTIRRTAFNAAGKSIRVTCSIGLAWAVHGDDWESLIGRADDALYEAKAAGRNQLVERRRPPIVQRVSNERRLTPS